MAAALDDVLITHQLGSRARRALDPARENDAIRALVRHLAAKPQHLFHLLVDIALELCHAGSAGVSLRERTPDGGDLFRWVAVAGQLAAHAGATAPADASLCGVCLARGTPELFSRPARRFAYLASLPVPVHEALVIPFHVNGDVRGTVWVHSHDPAIRFDAEHARLMAGLADVGGAAVQRLEAEAALRRSEERRRDERGRDEPCVREQLRVARVVSDHVAEALFLTDAAGTVTFANRGAERLLGRPAGELVGRLLHDLVHPDGNGGRCGTDGCALLAGAAEDADGALEVVFVRGDGSAVPVSCSRSRIDGEGSPGVIVVARDDTVRKRVEQERGWYVSQLAGLGGAAASIHSLSLDDALAVITERAREIVGAHQAMTTVTSLAEGGPAQGSVSFSEKYAAWHGDEVRPVSSPLDALVCDTNRPVRLTAAELEAHPARARLDDRTSRPPLRGWLAAPLRDRDGNNVGLIQLSDKYDGDFTEQDEAVLRQLAEMASVAIHNAWLYEEGQTARAAAEAANAAKDEFLTMLAHELRNPLGVILNGVSVLDRHGSRAPESIRVRDLIRHHTRHLARLLDDLLDLARISQGKIPLRSEVLDLRAVVDITVQAYRDGVEARGQKVSVSMPDVAVYVYGDRTRLQQITGNLLDNASRYTPAGGSVWVSVEEINDEVLLSVRDNGIGIPPDKLESIFELFTQLDVSVACSEGGLGIGLALVRRLTEMHGGRVHAHSDGRGSGSEFVVRLRRARPPVAAHAPTPPRARRAYDILLVEDNSAARETLRFVLELEGHRVQIAADGLGGVDAGVRRRPDVAFVDIGLPGLDGYEVGRRLRAVHGDGVRLFAITGYGRPEDIRRARHAGFDGHLTKPVEVDEVLRVLGSL
jgi:PAS domain S-box-containing protein